MMRVQSASAMSRDGTRLVMPAATTMMWRSPSVSTVRVSQRLERRDVGDVSRHPQRPAASRLDLAGHLVHEVFAPAGGHDIGAGVGQSERERPGRCRSCRRRRRPRDRTNRTTIADSCRSVSPRLAFGRLAFVTRAPVAARGARLVACSCRPAGLARLMAAGLHRCLCIASRAASRVVVADRPDRSAGASPRRRAGRDREACCGRLPPPLVVERRHHLDQRGDDRDCRTPPRRCDGS